jgi:LEA14-like dessication related protein
MHHSKYRFLNRTRGALGLALALTVTGCGGSIFKQPEITLESVQIGGLGLSGGTLVVDLQVVNPNRFSLSANRLNYDLAMRDPETASDTSWTDFAEGAYDQPFTVGGGETAHVQIPVSFSYSGLGAAAGSMLRRGTFTYRASGTADVRTPLGTHQVPFRKTGTVTLLGTR